MECASFELRERFKEETNERIDMYRSFLCGSNSGSKVGVTVSNINSGGVKSKEGT